MTRAAAADDDVAPEGVPGCLFTVGAGGPTAAPHHHHAFDLNERAIGLIAEIFTRAALSALRPA
ncbi:hypothetical protein [Sorangium sp. So ce590]|uniref:hypothetical protein n=1 Tax=unclassified Sorangium TaxID=2621164 RepID=UPI003F631A74